MPVMTLPHILFALFILAVMVTMALRKDVVIICVVGSLVVGFTYHQSLVPTIQSLFNGMIVAAGELMTIIMIISLMVAMLKALNALGADYKMFYSLRKLIQGPAAAFMALGAIMYVASSFFWPTPATGLVGTLLIPFAVQAGLPPMIAAVVCNILGHGMALSGDLVIQGALKLTAGAANVPVEAVFMPSAILSITTGLVAALVVVVMYRGEIVAFANSEERKKAINIEVPYLSPYATLFAVGVPLVFLAVIVAMVTLKIRGGDASALLGGTGFIVLALATLMNSPKNCFDDIVKHLRDGFLFGMKIFTPVLPIAAFFLLGSSSSSDILGEGAPAYLFDIGQWLSAQIPMGKVSLAFGLLITGIVTGLDGSGFSGLPLTGSLAAALAGPAGYDVPTLAVIGQMGAIWSGGGCLTPWAFGLAATAGIAGVDPQALVRKNFIPVGIGLVASTIVGILLM